MAKNTANKTTYWVIGIIILVVVVAFGVYKITNHFLRSQSSGYATTPQEITTNNSQTNQSAGTTNSGLPNKTDTSNQQLDQDMQNIQNGMNQLQEDQNTSSQDTTKQSQDVPQQ